MEEPEHLSIFLRDISREWSSISGTAFVELLAIEQRERIGGVENLSYKTRKRLREF